MRKQLTFAAVLILLVAQAAIVGSAVETEDSHIITGVPYHPMLDGFCAMTTMWMNLEYYGVSSETASLLNLGWSHGFFYWVTPQRTWAYPNTGPVEEIIYAAEVLGFEAKEFKHESLDEAKTTIVKYVSKDMPVVVQSIGHTVLAYGYEKGGDVIIYHDPHDPTSAVTKDTSRPGSEYTHAAQRADIKRWEEPPFNWGVFGYHCVVLTPNEKETKIDWKQIWRRSAGKTLGTVKNPYPAKYGVEGIQALIEDMKKKEFKDEEEKVKYLLGFEGTFFLGTGFRREAAAFLAGQASAMESDALLKASNAFRQSSHLFRAGYNLVLLLKKDSSKAEIVKKGFLDLLAKITIFEERGADALLEAANAK